MLFRRLGVRPGSVLLVHASLRGSGLRSQQLLAALIQTLGPEGTVVVPSFTPENSSTSRVHRAATARLTAAEQARMLAHMPPFDQATTPSPTTGRFAEGVRTAAHSVRSSHPQTSFAALGRRAAELMEGHELDCHLGERSPMARLYEAAADILLFRVGYEVCTAFHLAEYRRGGPLPHRRYRCVVDSPGNWVEFTDVALSDADFAEVGSRLPAGLARTGAWLGRPVSLMPMRPAVDRAQSILAEIRHGLSETAHIRR
ncbi:aminoglycoside N(3)-acetyltransferase [Streptacidiphilus carbonis]|uniref:aminoglycoside N(3)-acetyltransferase n=1 Tax=Streptacidiphilus carbonis TaxID=105422 RepID=UPI0005A7FCA8|nr:AAC(3) family N-acetyltransferase [Streptacidiphilus carbonis]